MLTMTNPPLLYPMTVKALFARRVLGSSPLARVIDNDGDCLKTLAATVLITAFGLGAAVIVSGGGARLPGGARRVGGLVNVNSSFRNNRFLKFIEVWGYLFNLALCLQNTER